jgi:hypothetical protein
MLLLLATMGLGVILLLARETNGRRVHVNVAWLGLVRHHGSWEWAREEAEGVGSARAFGDEAGLTLFIVGDTWVIEGDAQVGGVPRNGGVTISDSTKFPRFEYLFAALADWKFPIGKWNIDRFVQAWNLVMEHIAPALLFTIAPCCLPCHTAWGKIVLPC